MGQDSREAETELKGGRGRIEKMQRQYGWGKRKYGKMERMRRQESWEQRKEQEWKGGRYRKISKSELKKGMQRKYGKDAEEG